MSSILSLRVNEAVERLPGPIESVRQQVSVGLVDLLHARPHEPGELDGLAVERAASVLGDRIL